jgi:hypothetical protein
MLVVSHKRIAELYTNEYRHAGTVQKTNADTNAYPFCVG